MQTHSCFVKKEEQKRGLTGSLRLVLLKGSAALSQWSLISESIFGEPQLSAGGGRRRIICCSHELLSVVLRDSILLVNIPKPVLGNPVEEDTWPLGKFSLPAPGVSHPSPYPSTSMQEPLSDIHVTHFEESSDKVTCLHFSCFQRVLPPTPSGMGVAHGSPAGPPPHMALWRTQLYWPGYAPSKTIQGLESGSATEDSSNPM